MSDPVKKGLKEMRKKGVSVEHELEYLTGYVEGYRMLKNTMNTQLYWDARTDGIRQANKDDK